MTSPQEIIRTRLKEILGPATPTAPNGLNVLAYLSFKNGSDRYLAPGIIIDERHILKGTHGIEVRIDPVAQENYSNYSPLEERTEVSCGVTMDLWLPEDIEATEYEKNLSTLVANGIDAPLRLPSMGLHLNDKSVTRQIGYGLKTIRIDGVQGVQKVRMMAPRPRYIQDGGQVLERVKFVVSFCPEICWAAA